MEVTLIAESLDPSKGSASRYGYELSKVKEIKNVVDFSRSLKTSGFLDDWLNKGYRRKKIIERNSANLGKLLHFTQPESFIETRELDKKKIMLTVHDLAPFKTKDFLNQNSAKERVSDKKRFIAAIKMADRIITDSTQTRDEIVDLIGITPEKIAINPLGISDKFKKIDAKKAGIIGYFGSMSNRKRVDKLIEDFIASGISAKFKLVVYGDGSKNNLSLKNKYEKFGSVIFKESIKEEELVKVINSFDYFFYPTLYEGFGLSLAECVACGVPSFIYKDAIIPQEVRKYALEVEKIDDIEKYDKVEIEKDFADKSNKIKKEFTWENNIDNLLKEYKNLLG
ncbi:MAG: glycosyltransferase [Candidatus Parvarchaeota archaeon]|nr:glycosyltransferase [Candidatus Parvarchaeum tengchongense]MCW1298740.1 glycosyltransferase [Candidatus Parvarchaeum tengchongense]MCW1312052.1 glycosyltransferase [Candidatus Parvarchaeum tengchongense]